MRPRGGWGERPLGAATLGAATRWIIVDKTTGKPSGLRISYPSEATCARFCDPHERPQSVEVGDKTSPFSDHLILSRTAERQAQLDEFNAMPKGLSRKGQEAYGIIMEVLRAHDGEDTGGCKSFYSPAEWKARGEEYGTESELVVVYDGGDLRPFFNMDDAYPGYDLHEKMRQALAKAGLYAEECTGWYGAVYRS